MSWLVVVFVWCTCCVGHCYTRHVIEIIIISWCRCLMGKSYRRFDSYSVLSVEWKLQTHMPPFQWVLHVARTQMGSNTGLILWDPLGCAVRVLFLYGAFLWFEDKHDRCMCCVYNDVRLLCWLTCTESINMSPVVFLFLVHLSNQHSLCLLSLKMFQLIKVQPCIGTIILDPGSTPTNQKASSTAG